jgi:hypothetical protein
MIALRCPCNIGSHQTDHEEWSSHKIALHNPTTKRMCDVHKLHITQSVTMIDENSALRPNMQQHNNNEGWKPVSPSHLSRPCGARWGTLGLQAIAMRAQLRYQYQRYFMGGEGAWEHVNTCLTHSSNWTRAHNHVMTTLESICMQAACQSWEILIFNWKFRILLCCPDSCGGTVAVARKRTISGVRAVSLASRWRRHVHTSSQAMPCRAILGKSTTRFVSARLSSPMPQASPPAPACVRAPRGLATHGREHFVLSILRQPCYAFCWQRWACRRGPSYRSPNSIG